MSITMDQAREAALTLTQQAVDTVRPNEDQERTRLLMCAFALYKSRQLRFDPAYGPDHPMTIAYLDLASEQADANGSDMERAMTRLLPPVGDRRLMDTLGQKD